MRQLVAAATMSLLVPALLAAPALAQDGSGPGDGPRGEAKPPKGSEQAFTISDPRIDESSGLAVSAVHDGITYTVNDSGNAAEIYMLDSAGETSATLTMRLIEPVDWEALSTGPDSRIWVGDIGDNNAEREQITLYRFIEPEGVFDQNLSYGGYDFVYPDGAHDAEALLVHPETGRVYIVTKGLRGGAIYQGPEVASSDGVNELEKIGDAPKMITDGDFLPDGSAMILRGYGRAYVIDFPSLEKQRELALPRQELGESLAVTSDGQDVLVGSEGENSPVWRVPVDGPPPTEQKQKPSDESGKSEDGPDAAGGDDSSEDEEQSASGGVFGGFFAGMPGWVPISVILVALAAGVVSFPAKKRKRRPPRLREDEDPWSEPWSPPRPPATR